MVTTDEAKQMIVADLKEELKKRGASIAGKKADLLERLLELIGKENQTETIEVAANEEENAQNLPVVEDQTTDLVPLDAGSTPSDGDISKNVPPPNGEIENKEATLDKDNQSVKLIEAVTTEEIIVVEAPIVQMEVVTDEKTSNETIKDLTATAKLVTDELSHQSVPVVVEEPLQQQPAVVEETPQQPQQEQQQQQQQQLSLNERIKQNMKKRKEQDGGNPDLPTKTARTLQSDEFKSTHIRIDNFQRPLNVKNLVKWLTEITGISVTEEMLWINTIKTHAYIDLQSTEDAETFIHKITGLKYPNTSTATLAVHFTNVTVNEAPNSSEAAMKPGEWLKSRSIKRASNNNSSNIHDDNSVLGKRKSDEAKLAGANLFKRAAVTPVLPHLPNNLPQRKFSTLQVIHSFRLMILIDRLLPEKQRKKSQRKSLISLRLFH